MTLNCDVAIIGAGTAGMAAYRAARAHTERVLLIEAAHYGTTCARVGCMPSKLLIAAADAAQAVREAHRFGVQAEAPRIDGRAVMARVRSERDRFVGFVLDTVHGWPEATRLLGRARFVGARTLDVDGRRIEARAVVVATGSRPRIPPGWRERLGARLIVNDDVFEWQDLPASLAVVGAGVIGLELALALHRLGVRVRLFARGSRVGPLTDPELQALGQQLFGEALPLTLHAAALEPVLDGDQVVLGGERFDALLCTTGREPNLDGLGLEALGLPRDDLGHPRLSRHTGQWGDSPVFVAGDATQDRPLLHEAADAGRIAGDNAARWPRVHQRPRRAPLAVVFSDPQIAIAGASHAELTAAGASFDTGRVSFADQGRSRVMLANRGALHVYAERGTGRLLGAEMIGPAAEHIGHLLAWSVQRGDTVQQMLDSPFYHPVVEEGLRTALRQLHSDLHLPEPPLENCMDCDTSAEVGG
ncbi:MULTISPECIES: dihydrolipoyl dehydrogenase [Roseateles]|uniref:Dihydrolipoyl dehydrogenase n=1 Tax=Pelomonas caseinilytica TaxID=2906763 RepID=A0ABS8XJ56_9BURK|nr:MULTISPECIES: dihydrolipoyl dehydrogenase [unclassified Roseateles]MCE4539765.1 dihydrolipoyl dehydrogenase [Pelomonas sp. P7]HEV6963816.1 dihydrolipoyl dehydrogenase [Roseateles sp.]